MERGFDKLRQKASSRKLMMPIFTNNKNDEEKKYCVVSLGFLNKMVIFIEIKNQIKMQHNVLFSCNNVR